MSNAMAAQCCGVDWTRWVVLLLTCAGLFGQFYAYDNPSALNEQLKLSLVSANALPESSYAYFFSLLYSVYSIPNIVLPLVMGMGVDRCGARVLLCVLALCVVLGHTLFAIGVGSSSTTMMLTGRVIFGIGGESIQVAQNCLLFRWFKGAEVAFALGLNLSVARAGSVLNDVLSPSAAQHWGITGAVWLGTGLCVASCLANLACAAVDRREGGKRGLPEAGEEKVVLGDLFRLGRCFWLLVALCVLLYSAILPFNNVASAFFIETFYAQLPLAEAQQRAGNVMSLIFLSSAFGTPPFGGIVDLVGLRTYFLMFSSVLVVITYALIFAAPPAMSTLLLGIVYTVFAGALWPAFTQAVPEALLGTAYGVATALQNAGLAVVPLLVGRMQSATSSAGHFGAVMHSFLALGIASTVVSVGLWHSNSVTNGSLNLPSADAGNEPKKSSERTTLL
mmetsp:Transcript_105158/g.307348  ORF Transcript_105158/g.307348 Transcript_105158/m.307348 type:complete len:449 (+) Transcript_105158:187-1533(+)